MPPTSGAASGTVLNGEVRPTVRGQQLQRGAAGVVSAHLVTDPLADLQLLDERRAAGEQVDQPGHVVGALDHQHHHRVRREAVRVRLVVGAGLVAHSAPSWSSSRSTRSVLADAPDRPTRRPVPVRSTSPAEPASMGNASCALLATWVNSATDGRHNPWRFTTSVNSSKSCPRSDSVRSLSL